MESAITSQGRVKEYILAVEIQQKESIMGFSGGRTRDFIRISVALPKHVPTCRSILEKGFNSRFFESGYQTFESNIPFSLRFMIDRDVVGASWIEATPGTYRLRDKKSSTCQIEFDVAYDAFTSHSPEGEWSKLAPFRILSFGIMGRIFCY
jgi:DNA polymerase delta subunit 1